MAEEAELKEIPVKEILDKIQKGEPAEYDHIKVIGDLDIGRLDLPVKQTECLFKAGFSEKPKIISSSMKITNSRFDGSINFSGTHYIIFEDSIDFDNTTFGKDVNFSGASFNKNVRFYGATFNQNAHFDFATFISADFLGATFSQDTDFYGAVFNKDTCFNGATFSEDINFGYAKFCEGVDFRDATFSRDADFEGAEFDESSLFWFLTFCADTKFMRANFKHPEFSLVTFIGRADFHGATFTDAKFNGVSFRQDTDFEDAEFIGADFRNATFSQYVNFSEAIFQKDARFNSATFNQVVKFRDAIFSIADFTSAQFEKDALFEGAEFGSSNFTGSRFVGHAHFNRSRFFIGSEVLGRIDFKFSGEANFVGSQFSQSADFTDSQFYGIASFNGSNFSEDVFFDNANFEAKLSLNRTKYDKLYIRWKQLVSPKYQLRFLEEWRRVKKLEYDDAAYLLLIEDFKNLGFFEDADNCYYSYRTEHRRTLPDIYKPFDWILWLFYGYGVKPLRPLGWLVILLLACGLLYSVTGHSPIEAFNTSLTLSLSGTQLIENPNHPATAMQYWIFTSEKLLASLFCALFLVSVGRTIVR